MRQPPPFASPVTSTRRAWTFLPAYWGFWIGFFVVARALFLLYHAPLTAALSASEIARTFGYGLRLDASLAAYFTLPAAVGLAVGRRLPPSRLGARGVLIYTVLLLAVASLVIVVDLELYGHWGFRIDTTLAQYLNTPREMAASAGAAPIGWLVVLYVALVAGSAWVYQRTLGRWSRLGATDGQPVTPRTRWTALGIALGAAALLVLPLRGGWQQIPVNQSDVYFSTHPFANHAAVNAGWNLLYFALRGENSQNPYHYLSDSAARRAVQALYAPARQPVEPAPSILRVRKPNVLVIILESFTAKLVGSVGGERGVTPQLDSAAADGLLFTQVYAAGNRSEKGLVAILSGFPSQTTTSISRVPRKAERLPHLAQQLRGAGYRRATYWYGGELAFANMKAYLLAGGYDRLFEKKDFPARLYDVKWGVRDADLLPRLADSLRRQPQPWLSTVFTLSSHEPYDVPGRNFFPGIDETNRFRNAVHYTDRAVGRLLATLRADRPLWDSTLVVLIADHGHLLPDQTPEYDPAAFHIPLLLTGGALKPEWRGQQNLQIGSQTDLLATLLAQLSLPIADLPWSRNLLTPIPAPWAFYVYNDGFGLVSPTGNLMYDNVGRRSIIRDPGITNQQFRAAQALMQETHADFLRR
jgi:phosphoglycerol transferase MdoB-like AlkP superfamily enzyme